MSVTSAIIYKSASSSIAAENAAAEVGLTSSTYSTVTDDAAFLAALNAADPATTVLVIDSPANVMAQAALQAIIDFIGNGGRAIMSYWSLDAHADLQAAFGVAVTEDLSSPETVMDGAASDIFDGLASEIHFEDRAADDGDRLAPLGGATEEAHFSGGGSAIVIANDGRTIVNGFLFWDMVSDPTPLIANQLRSVIGEFDANVIDGTPGDDRGEMALVGTSGEDVINGYEGNDELIGLGADDELNGGEDSDFLRGNAGNDALHGGDGDDYLNGNAGDDLLDGGAGYDRATFFTGATAGVTVDLSVAGPQATGQGNDTLVGIENVSGTAYNDVLTGDAGDNWLWGSTSRDADGVVTGLNNDTLSGGDGNDLLTVGAGDHLLAGGDGIDTVQFSENGEAETGVTVSLALQGSAQATGNGSWTLTGIENLSGGTADDALTGDGAVNVLAGDAGNDSLAGGGGNDELYGDGSINADTGGLGYSGPIALTSDTLAGGNDVLEGGEGDDYLDGGMGSDTASYANASGAVEAYLDGGFGEAFGADGYDQLYFIENLTGSAYNDLLSGDDGDNVLTGGDGHDGLRGYGGNDSLYGGNGDDFLNAGEGDDTIDGGAGIDRASFYTGAVAGVTVDLNLQGMAQDTGQGLDTLTGIENVSGTFFNDTLIGDDGDNVLWGSPATLPDGTISPDNNDTLIGNGGNDLLVAGIGNHMLSGGDGTDTVGFTENGAAEPGLTVSLELQGVAQSTGAGDWLLTGIENLSGGLANDSLTGDGGNNVLAGNSGDDQLRGGAGDDTLYGDGRINWDSHGTGGSGPITTWADVGDIGAVSGDDVLEGGLGNDLIHGGAGVDTATYANAAGGVDVHLGFGFAGGADGDDTLVGIENVIGSEFADSLNGDGNANMLDGLGGNDFIQGQGGDDTIFGGDGDDTLRGDAGENSLAVSGDDVIHGGNGNDGLRGGLGNDQLYGGANNDLLRGNNGVDYFDGGADDGEGVNGIGDRVSFYEQRATQGVIADLRTGIISNDGFGNVETMVGIESLGADTAYADIFYGNDERNALFGNRGDSLYGFGGDDAFQLSSATAITDGGAGTDRLVLSSFGGWLLPDVNADGLAEVAADPSAGWTVDLAAGTLLDGYGNSGSVAGIEIVDGTIFADVLIGDANANTLNGGDGDDVLNGREGDDTLDGGNGVDTASYANAAGAVQVELYDGGLGEAFGADGYDLLTAIENLTGSAFNDVLIGDGQANRVEGGGGQDYILGADGNDTLEGGADDDYLRGDAGDDVMRGGSGLDRVSFATATGGVTVSLAVTGPQATGQGNDTLEGIEHVSGTQFNDTITGSTADNWLWGGSNGAGVTGNDVINGGAGNDLIEVGAGNHTLNGGSGTGDTLSLRGNGTDISAAGVTYSLANQGSSQNTEQGMMMTSGFENVSGSNHADSISGNSQANTLAGDIGDDMLRGEDGNDVLYGDGRIGIDTNGTGLSGSIATWSDVTTLTGDAGGNDIMLGGRGDDFLYGGRGDDTMTGNQGVDRYVIETGSGDDRITDFAAGIDKIRFDGVAGVDDFSDLTITKSGNNTVISWGTDDSILLVGVRNTSVGASSFEFAPPPAMAAAAGFDGAGKSGPSFGLDDVLGVEALAATVDGGIALI